MFQIKNYYEFKYKYSDFYTYVIPNEFSKVYNQQHFGCLSGEDRLGRKMCVLIPCEYSSSLIIVK